MNYQKIHDSIIKNAKEQTRDKKTGYFELHHIQMRAVGGSDEPENLVLLTPKEHFIIHYLLWKIHKTRLYRDPVLLFKHKGAKTSRLYEAVRISHIKEMKENNPSLYLSESAKISKSEKLSKYASNRTDEHRRKISAKAKGKKHRLGAVLTENTKSKISNSLLSYFQHNTVSEETRRKIGQSHLGLKHSEKSIKQMKNSALKRKRYICPLCSKNNLDAGNFTQHMMKLHSFSKEEINDLRNRV